MAGVAACAVLGWFTVRGEPVPLLWRADLGFHELGHFLTYWLPDLGTALMGSVFQVAIPLALAGYFAIKQKDLLGAGVCTGWAASSLQNVSVYVADAPFQVLPLVGGEHDWAFILGELGALDAASGLALTLRVVAILLVGAGAAVCSGGLLRARIDPTILAPGPRLAPSPATHPSGFPRG